MPRGLSAYDVGSKLAELRARGFTVLEEVLDVQERRDVESALDRFLVEGPETALQDYGAKVFALFTRAPALARLFEASAASKFVERACGGAVRHPRTGARFADAACQPRIAWHHHDDWGSARLQAREHFERVVAIGYLDGSGDDAGPLIVLPRDFRDPLGTVPPDPFAPLPGEIAVEAPPGSFVITDAPLLHCARARRSAGLRRIFGAHVSPRSLVLAHAEDDPGLEILRLELRRRLRPRAPGTIPVDS